MIVNDEKLLEALKQAVYECQDCLSEFVNIFGWYTHYGKRALNFVKFFKDYGIWTEAVSQIPYYTRNENSIEGQLKIYEQAYNQGLSLFDRASNALYDSEITDSYKDGGARFFAMCGKFEMHTKMITKMVDMLNQSKIAKNDENNANNYNFNDKQEENY